MGRRGCERPRRWRRDAWCRCPRGWIRIKRWRFPLRYGARSAKPGRPVLTAPQLDAPVVIGEWTVTGDEGRQLIPRGGTADLVRPVLAESGWEWAANVVAVWRSCC